MTARTATADGRQRRPYGWLPDSRRLLPTVILLVALIFTAVGPARPATAEIIEGSHDLIAPDAIEVVNGNLLTFGNSILECDDTRPTLTSQTCAQMHAGQAANNNFWMKKVDVDDVDTTRTSSRARVTVPEHARVKRAILYYGGTRGENGAVAECTGSGPVGMVPPDAALDSAVSVQLGTTRLQPAPTSVFVAGLYYAASTDITQLFDGESDGSEQTITVGNIPTPQGYGCGVGWSIAVAYDFGQYDPAVPESAVHKIFFYSGLQIQDLATPDNVINTTGFRSTGAGAEVAVTAYEGDATLTGDSLAWAADGAGSYQPLPPPPGVGPDNFFTSRAIGQLPLPGYPGMVVNGGVDVAMAPIALDDGSTSLALRSRSTSDGYAIQAITLSIPIADIRIDKSAATGRDLQTIAAPAAPHFTITVTNNSLVAIESLQIADPLAADCARSIPGTANDPALPVGQSVTYGCVGQPVGTAGYTNVASAEGTIGGAVVASATDSSQVQAAAVQVQLSAPAVVAIGDPIPWTAVVTNIGSAPLEDQQLLSDNAASCNGSGLDLAPGESRTIACSSRATTAVINTVTASGTSVDGEATVTDSAQARVDVAGLALDKRVIDPGVDPATGRQSVGSELEYGFTVRNLGTVPLSDLELHDPLLGGAISCPAAAIPAGGSVDCAPTAYPLQPDDLAAAEVINRATASASTEGGIVVTDTAELTTELDPLASVSLAKTVQSVQDLDGNGRLDVGDTVDFGYRIRNTGYARVAALQLTDPLIRGAIGCERATLAPGGETHCGPARYALTAADLDSEGVTGAASVGGTDPAGRAVGATARASLAVTPVPELQLIKSADPITDSNGSGRVDAGDTLDFRFLLRNTGTTRVTGISISDALLSSAPLPCPVRSLDINEQGSCGPFHYVLTQRDLDRGSVSNTAAVTATGSDAPIQPTVSTVQVPVHGTASLQLSKRSAGVQDSNDNGIPDAGDLLGFTFSVTNSGSITVADVRVDDPGLGGLLAACRVATLPPGATASCGPVQRPLTADDLEAGTITNTATVSALPLTAGAHRISRSHTVTVSTGRLAITGAPAGSVMGGYGAGLLIIAGLLGIGLGRTRRGRYS